jgi:hypothetical protein
MIRGRVLAALIALAAVVAGAGCGGGDDPQVANPGPKAAEDTVREFLVAGVKGDVDRACPLLSDDLNAELDQSIPCAALVEFQTDLAKQGKTEFDSVKIDPSNVDELELQTVVFDDGQSANVTGPTGEQTFTLKVLDGNWLITSVPAAEGSS